jgi:inosine-uridine nucleoside N-ribohydrolase
MSLPPPSIDPERRRRMLGPPSGPVRVVIDTDTANEIDDQFALAWVFTSLDRLEVEGLYAEPYSFGVYRDDLLEAARLRRAGQPLPPQLAPFAGWLAGLERVGWSPEDLRFVTPDEGMERSYQEIFKVLDLMGAEQQGTELQSAGLKRVVRRGAERYMTAPDDVVDSPAVDHLIERALANDPRPLYVVAIGCPTNVAAAIVKEPAIRERIVVTWTSSYPTNTRIHNHSFNLDQDLHASKLLYDSGVPLVYLPGYHIGAQLRLSLPEMEAWVRGRGAIGDYLHELYTHNPIHEQRGIEGHFGRSWVIWDLINVAWLLNPDWVPTHLVPTPVLGSDKLWQPRGGGAWPMREAYEIDRDGIFRDFLGKLDAAATR